MIELPLLFKGLLMSLFRPKFPASDINSLLRFYWVSQSPRMEQIEHDIENRAPRIRSNKYLTRDEFQLVCSWTAIRAVGHYKNNADTIIQKTTTRAFEARDDRQRIQILTELNGVSYPTASTVLHFFHPDIYPIWTIPSLWSLGVTDYSFNFSTWLAYIQSFRQLVTEWEISPRDLDRALWQYHYNKNAREVEYSDDV